MNWVPFALASIPAAVAIFAALTAARSARKTKQLEIQAQRVRDLENRLAEKKYGVYQPMIDLLSKMLDKKTAEGLDTDELGAEFLKFDAWVAIYGSDEALTAWHNLRQGAFHDAPPLVFIRLYVDFVLAARRDMGHPETTASGLSVVGTRINDLYTTDASVLRALLTLNWSDMEEYTGWKPPWIAATSAVEKGRTSSRPPAGDQPSASPD